VLPDNHLKGIIKENLRIEFDSYREILFYMIMIFRKIVKLGYNQGENPKNQWIFR